MKRLLSLTVVGMLSSNIYANTIMAGEQEIGCHSKSMLEFLWDGIAKANSYVDKVARYRVSNCFNIGEGMDLKVLKTKSINLKYNKKYKKAILVKLPNGNTAYSAR